MQEPLTGWWLWVAALDSLVLCCNCVVMSHCCRVGGVPGRVWLQPKPLLLAVVLQCCEVAWLSVLLVYIGVCLWTFAGSFRESGVVSWSHHATWWLVLCSATWLQQPNLNLLFGTDLARRVYCTLAACMLSYCCWYGSTPCTIVVCNHQLLMLLMRPMLVLRA